MNILRKLVIASMVIILSLSNFGTMKMTFGQDENERLAVSLIIDTSGSMKSTDPDSMRETASRIFIDLLSAEDSLGILSFSTEVTEIQPMTIIGQTKGMMKSNLTDKLIGDGDTDYLKAFQAAYRQLSDVQEKNTRKVIVFITDGNPDPNPARNREVGFLAGYMDEFWNTVRTLGEEAYPVYTVGIGALDHEVINRIALETKGKSSVFSDASEMAMEFFHITAELKNREVFVGEKMDIRNGTGVSFDSGKHTLQTTFVITHALSEISVSVETPDGEMNHDLVHMENNEKYTLVTIDEPDEKNSGQWHLKIEGNGEAEVFGAKDQAVKVWMEEPISGYRYPAGEALDIIASLSGSGLEGVEIDGVISQNGKEVDRMILSEVDGVFRGASQHTTSAGEYLLTLSATKDGEEISRISSSFVLMNLPVMNPDFGGDDLKMTTGSSKIITSTLEIGANSLLKTDDLNLEYFNLVGEINGENVVFPMSDDGNRAFGDAKAGDGRFSTMVNFDSVGQMDLHLEARGLYQDELFILEKSLGEVSVYGKGNVSVDVLSDALTGLKGKELKMELALKSDSHFDEVIELSIPEELGLVFPSEILLAALEEKKVSVTFLPNRDVDFTEFSLPLVVSLKNENTVLTADNTEISITTISQVSKVKGFFESYGRELLITISSLLFAVFLYTIIGLRLYKGLVRRRSHLKGKLFITYGGNNQTEEIDLKGFRKSKVVISLSYKSGNNSEVDIQLDKSRYSYKLIIENQLDQSKSKILNGYRSLFKKSESELSVRTTEPGIMILENQIHIKIPLKQQTEFKSGDYFFRYEYNGHKDMKTKNEGRNILEGRL